MAKTSALSQTSPVTITTPNVKDLEAEAQLALSPATGFVVIDNETFIEAGERYNTVVAFIDSVTQSFKEPKTLAYKAHKAITALEAKFLQPALLAKEHLAFQQLEYRRRLDIARIAEEDRIRREQQKIAEAEHTRQQAILDAEVAALRQQRQQLDDEKCPWEFGEADEAASLPVERVVLPEPEVAAVRLPSNVPFVAGGPSVRNSPWMAKVDLKTLVAAAAKDDNLLQYLEAKLPLLNAAAREHGQCVGDIIPGVTAYREERLARG